MASDSGTLAWKIPWTEEPGRLQSMGLQRIRHPEILDTETLQPLPDGELGELTFTTFTKEACPLIRYRTRDLCTLSHEKCGCGRTLARISKPVGRSDDMLIIRGVNVFPTQIETVLLDMPETAPYYAIIVDRVGALDTLELQVELAENAYVDEVRSMENIRKKLSANIQSALGISAQIKLMPPHSLPRVEGKAKRVEDRRKLH